MATWLLLTMTFPRARSRERVAIWRDLRGCGAIPIAGVHALPARAECEVFFGAIAAQVTAQGGEAHVLRVTRIGGLDDAELTKRFHAERGARYRALEHDLSRISGARAVAGARRRFDGIAAVDYFDAPARRGAEQALVAAERAQRERLTAAAQPAPPDLRGKRWVTVRRPGPDALACAWLIRRFADASALIRYGDRARTDEIAFAMPGAPFEAHGAVTAFDRLCDAFGARERGLDHMRRLVRALEHPAMRRGSVREAPGIAAALRGWRLTQSLGDAELEARSRVLFDGAFASFGLEGRGASKIAVVR